MQVNLHSSTHEAYYFTYEDEPNLELLIAPLTPLVDEQCTDAAMQHPPAVNGRFRRQVQLPKFQSGKYTRLVFLACVKGWRFKDPSTPALIDEHGEAIPYSEENKEAISRAHSGLVAFGYDIAKALGEISAEQVRQEREAFRRPAEVSPRLPQAEL